MYSASSLRASCCVSGDNDRRPSAARSSAKIAVRRGQYLRGYVYRFLQECIADLQETTVREAIAVE